MSYNPDINYCTLAPKKLFGVDFGYACYLHDRQYRNEVKKRKTRLQTDIDFREKIYSYFEIKNKRIKGRIVSGIYYCGVRLFAWFAWVK